MRISVDTDRCVGAGQCVLSAPDVFDQDDMGIVLVLAEPADEPAREAARQAGVICPSQAITVSES
ncbi:ferredoxin [Streptomyces chlorus]|uniref:Ferredoxin n=1 Tax=Streptomyces chlorus TaxID=887452 RepID=A0ABW1E3X1_9ACTN|nr:ferredoxin [Streptomyces sp. Wb2n-11]